MKEKQIDKQAVEEMAKVVKSSLDGLGCGNFNFTGAEISIMFAKALCKAGYRKQSDNVIELPCKVGDKVYRTFGNYCGEKIFEGVVDQITIYNNREIRFWVHGHPLGFACEDIGETVFLTQEEAEAKMKGGG